MLGSGQTDEREFWMRVGKKHGLRQVSLDENLLGRAFIEHLEPFPKVGNLVKTLAILSIKTAVLSNTIEPHARALRPARLYDGFDAVFLSHEIGLRKLNKDIYEYALHASQTEPVKTIFIDDDPKNTLAATQIGMHGITFINPEQLQHDLRQFIPDL